MLRTLPAYHVAHVAAFYGARAKAAELAAHNSDRAWRWTSDHEAAHQATIQANVVAVPALWSRR